MAVEMKEINSVPTTPSTPLPTNRSSPSPFCIRVETPTGTPRTPSRFMTPLASPMKKAMGSMRECLEDIGHLTKLDPMDQWLPITESRNGKAFYSAFHTLCSGIGFQALVLPVAFASLGWTWGILCLSTMFIWQLYTLWILTQLHEAVPGTRYSRYLHLCISTFGEKLAKGLAKFPIMYLSGGTCTALIVFGGGSMKLFFEIVCGPTCKSKPVTAIEWYLVFVCLAVVISQLPNLNSMAGVSLIGAATAIGYCTTIWVLSVAKDRPAGVWYDPLVDAKSDVGRILEVVKALGIIAFAFRGHNLTLEIQATMPSTLKRPSFVPMWRGVKIAYTLVALCLFPIAIGGYWAYGNLIPPDGILTALHKFHGQDTSRAVLGLTTLLVVINCLSSFQIYAMPVFDNLESNYTCKHNKPCPRWLRSAIRVFFGSLAYLIAVAFPFLPDLAGLIGGIALPVTLAYPCIMWVLIKKPERWTGMWYLNWGLGILGLVLSVVLIGSGLWNLVYMGLKVRFFKAR